MLEVKCGSLELFEHLIVECSEFSQAETEGLKVWKWAILIFTLLHILTFANQMHLTFKWWLLSHSLKFKIYYPSEQSELSNKSYLWRGFKASLHNCPLPLLSTTLTLLVWLVYLVSHLMASLGNIQVGSHLTLALEMQITLHPQHLVKPRGHGDWEIILHSNGVKESCGSSLVYSLCFEPSYWSVYAIQGPLRSI